VQTSTQQTEKLLKEYTAIAATYDRRWSAYLDASLTMTLEVVTRLPATRVLDIACGTGLLLKSLAERPDHPELAGIDRVPAMLDVAKAKIGPQATLLEGEAEHLPFDDAGFDLITTTNALHYFTDVIAALQEMRRVISPGGNLVITDWCRNYFWMRLFNLILPWTQHAHVRTYTIAELENVLSQNGFKVVSKTRKKIDWFWGLMTIHATPKTTTGASPM
jgi:ubiquinone/menaquinone biosynthesis C-methylase UbiE